MKHQLKIYLKSFILLLGISLLLLNCEKEDVEINIPKSTISIKKITFNEIIKNKVIAGELNKFTSINSQNNDLSKSEIYNDEYGFSIETSEAIYIEYDSYHSYTFQVYRNVDSLYTENLLLSLQEDSTYKAYLINYNFTEQERELVANGDYVSLADKTTFTPLHNYNIEEVLNSLSKTIYYNAALGYCYILEEWTSELTGWTVLRELEVPCPAGYQDNEIDAGDSSSGGGTTYDNTGIPDDPNTSDTGNGGGEGGTASNSGENTGNEDINTENCVQDTNGDCIGNMTAPVVSNLAYITNNYLNGSLTPEQLNFLTNNKYINIEINDFLNSNRDTDNLITQQAKDIALEIIEAGINDTLISAFPFVKYPPNSNYASQYPKLTEYLKNELPKLANDALIVDAIKQYGSLTEQQVKDALKWGEGPTIKFTPLSSIHNILGRFNGLPSSHPEGFEGPEVIELNSYTFEDIEQQLQNGSEFDSNTLNFFIGIVILHELTHYGDFHYNGNMFNSNGEPGIDFVTEILGTSVDYPNDLGLIQEYLFKKKN